MNLPQPSNVLKHEWTEMIRANAAQAEKDRRLTKKQLALIHDQEWLNMLAPTAVGGKQKPITDVLQIIEALAWAEGSMGWMVGVSSSASWQGAFMEPETAKALFSQPKIAISYCRAATGTAEQLEGNKYRVSGVWQHSAGINDANVAIGNCVITQNGVPVMDENNHQKVAAFIFHKGEYTTHSTWKSMGMLATAGDGFEVKNLELSADKSFVMGQNQKTNGNLYHFPFLQLLEAGLAVNISGLTMHFLDLCQTHFANNTTPDGTLLINDRVVSSDNERLVRKFDVAREKLFYAVSILWQSVSERKPLYPSVLNKVSAATSNLTSISREVVNGLYPFCGLSVTEHDTEINRVWRDFQTASQHDILVYGGW